MLSYSNIVIIAFITVITAITIYFIFKKDYDQDEKKIEIDPFAMEYLKEKIRDLFHEVLNQNISELYLNKTETKKRQNQKAKLNKALRSCAQGNLGEKEYVKDYIKDLLHNYLNVNEITIDHVLPFSNEEVLTAQDKYEIMLCQYKRKFGFHAFEKLGMACGFEVEKHNENGGYYEVTENDIHKAYQRLKEPLTYIDKIELVAQRIYQESYGFSVIDETRDQMIDGISGGVSGETTEQYYFMEEILQSGEEKTGKTYDNVWVFLHGKPIQLSFMSFGSMSELIRVCKNLYRYDNVGHLTSSNGYKLTYLQDGSRVVVTRPKMASGWAFFVRKFDSAKKMTIEQLIRDDNKEEVIELCRWLMKGLINVVISGDQNSGKTTFLKTLFQYLDQRFPIRTTEQEFELWLESTYDNLNLKSFRGNRGGQSH